MLNWFRELWTDVNLGWMFMIAIRNTRKLHPQKNLTSRLNFVCEAIQYQTVKAQIALALRNVDKRAN